MRQCETIEMLIILKLNILLDFNIVNNYSDFNHRIVHRKIIIIN